MQGVEHSKIIYAPARETTLFHCVAHKADSGSEKPTAAGQHNIKLQVQPSGPNLVTSSAQRSSHGRWMVTDATLSLSSRGEQRVRRLTLSCSEGCLILL